MAEVAYNKIQNPILQVKVTHMDLVLLSKLSLGFQSHLGI